MDKGQNNAQHNVMPLKGNIYSISSVFNRTPQMATTVSTLLRSTTHPPCLEISPLRWGIPPAHVPWASSVFQQACPSPTSTPPLGQVPTACMTTASASCWVWAVAPLSSVSGSFSVAHSATPALLLTRSATAASAVTVSPMAMCSSIKTARHQPPPPPTIPSPHHRTQTSHGRSRSACRPTSDRHGGRVFEQSVKSSYRIVKLWLNQLSGSQRYCFLWTYGNAGAHWL